MNSLENVFARRAEKTSEAIYETVRDSWPGQKRYLLEALEKDEFNERIIDEIGHKPA